MKKLSKEEFIKQITREMTIKNKKIYKWGNKAQSKKALRW